MTNVGSTFCFENVATFLKKFVIFFNLIVMRWDGGEMKSCIWIAFGELEVHTLIHLPVAI
jgi:hypothetical protein